MQHEGERRHPALLSQMPDTAGNPTVHPRQVIKDELVNVITSRLTPKE